MVGHPKTCQHCQKRPVKNLKTVSIRKTFIASFGQTLFMLKSCSRCNKASSSSISNFSFSQEIGSSFVELVEASWLEARTATACDPMRHAALFMTLVLRQHGRDVCTVMVDASKPHCSRWQRSQGLSEEVTVCRDLCSCAKKQSADRDLIELAVEGRTDTLA